MLTISFGFNVSHKDYGYQWLSYQYPDTGEGRERLTARYHKVRSDPDKYAPAPNLDLKETKVFKDNREVDKLPYLYPH